MQAARKTTGVSRCCDGQYWVARCWLLQVHQACLPACAVLWVLFPIGCCDCAGAQWLLPLTD